MSRSYLYTDANGEEQLISKEEVDAIELAGCRSTLDSYVRSGDTHLPLNLDILLRGMKVRPFRVKEGARPTQRPQPPARLNGRKRMVRPAPVFHLRSRGQNNSHPTCGKRGVIVADVCGHDKFYRITKTKASVCAGCLAAYYKVHPEHK